MGGGAVINAAGPTVGTLAAHVGKKRLLLSSAWTLSATIVVMIVAVQTRSVGGLVLYCAGYFACQVNSPARGRMRWLSSFSLRPWLAVHTGCSYHLGAELLCGLWRSQAGQDWDHQQYLWDLLPLRRRVRCVGVSVTPFATLPRCSKLLPAFPRFVPPPLPSLCLIQFHFLLPDG